MRLLILGVSICSLIAGAILDYVGIADREIGEPLYRLAIAAIIPCIVLFFSNESALKAWSRFAMWAIPLALVLIVLTPVSGGSWIPLYSLNKEGVTLLVSGLFAIVSLMVIARASRKR